MKKSRLLGALCACLAFTTLVLSEAASATTIGFESDATGFVANGFTSNDAAGVHFSDSIGANLEVRDWSPETDGVGLSVYWVDTSGLIIDFDFLANSLSLDFGNDDTCCSAAGDIALLTLFNGVSQVGQTSVVMNRNDIMDQNISWSGAAFDRATFIYADSGHNPINLIEVVDNVTFSAVPVPAAVWLFGSGLIGLIGITRRKKV